MGDLHMKRNQWFRPVKNPRLDFDQYSRCGQPVFITIRACQNTVPFQTSLLCEMVIRTFLDLAKVSMIQVFVYCLMPDHFHFLISPLEDGISVISFTNHFKGLTTNLSWDYGRRGKLWQPRYFDHIVRSDENLSTTCEYILKNPIRKGLIDSIDDWPWYALVTN